jgi:hypothetical protein
MSGISAAGHAVALRACMHIHLLHLQAKNEADSSAHFSCTCLSTRRTLRCTTGQKPPLFEQYDNLHLLISHIQLSSRHQYAKLLWYTSYSEVTLRLFCEVSFYSIQSLTKLLHCTSDSVFLPLSAFSNIYISWTVDIPHTEILLIVKASAMAHCSWWSCCSSWQARSYVS